MKRLDHDNPPTLNDFGVLVQVKKSIRLRYQSATKKGNIMELHDFTWKFFFNVSFTKYYGLPSAIPKEMERNSNLNNPTWTVDRNNAVFILSTRYTPLFL